MSGKVEWFLDSGCTDDVTPEKSDFVQYRELGQAHNAEIADGKYLRIEGYGTVIGHSIMLDGMASLQIQNMLYAPEANKWLFLLIATRQSGKLHSFDMILIKNWNEVPQVIIVTLSDYTLWHRRMGHAYQCMTKHIGKNMEGGPHQITDAPSGACEGCEKGKSKRLPFPVSKSRANNP